MQIKDTLGRGKSQQKHNPDMLFLIPPFFLKVFQSFACMSKIQMTWSQSLLYSVNMDKMLQHLLPFDSIFNLVKLGL